MHVLSQEIDSPQVSLALRDQYAPPPPLPPPPEISDWRHRQAHEKKLGTKQRFLKDVYICSKDLVIKIIQKKSQRRNDISVFTVRYVLHTSCL